ncbi:MAG TPA: serine hydrolase domain-containing protein [Acidimicrobiales bacterium]|nr:serine hydrolase domain-containing protein [Acidimicrobiales bacterium]
MIVAPGFEPVADAVAAAVAEGGERGLGVAAHVDGQPVVDMWAGQASDGTPWTADTLAVIFSCTKGMTALCAHMLIDRGLLDPDAPVVHYWPEYGAAGKESTLVRHFLNHTAGVVTFPSYWEVIDGDGRGLEDTAAIVKRLAEAPPAWEPGTAMAYHALTYGWLVGELVQRIDGRTVGRFFADEVAWPLGLDLWIGLAPEHDSRVASPLAPPPFADPDAQALMDAVLAEALPRVRANDFSTAEALWLGSVFTPLDIEDIHGYLPHILNQPWVRTAEVPGGNGIGTAGALARMYAALSVGGSLDGVRLVSPDSIARVTAAQPLPDGTSTGYALGYSLALVDELPGVSAQTFGHGGAGGNMAFADPARGVGFGLVKNQMQHDNATAKRVVEALYSCL